MAGGVRAAAPRRLARLDPHRSDLPVLSLHRRRGGPLRPGAAARRHSRPRPRRAEGAAPRAGDLPPWARLARRLEPGPRDDPDPRRAPADRRLLSGRVARVPVRRLALSARACGRHAPWLLGGTDPDPRPGLRRWRSRQGGESCRVDRQERAGHPHLAGWASLRSRGDPEHHPGHRHHSLQAGVFDALFAPWTSPAAASLAWAAANVVLWLVILWPFSRRGLRLTV